MAARGRVRLKLRPDLERAVLSSKGVRDALEKLGADLEAQLSDLITEAVSSTRARNLGFGYDAVYSGTWVTTARRRSRSSRSGAYKSTGRLAGSIGHRTKLERTGWVLEVGSGAGGRGRVEYAGVYFWGYDPSGPRGHWSWGGNDVFEEAFFLRNIRYRAPFT